jgi:uncharacterized protein (DUF58 family)
MAVAAHRRAAGLALLGIVAAIAAFGFGTPALLPLAAGLLAAPVLAVAAVEACRRAVVVERAVEPRRLTAGGRVDVRVTLTGWPVRTGLVGLLDRTVAPGAPPAAGPLATAGGRRRPHRLDLGWTVAPARRGIHVLPPAELALSDPFGLAARTAVAAGGGDAVLVGPRTVPVAEALLVGEDEGVASGAGRHRHVAGLELDGIRDYRPGDSLSRVHWAQSARRGRLQTKDLRAPTGGGRPTAVLLDCAADETGDRQAFEVAVSAAASIARGLVAAGHPVALQHTGTGPQATGRSWDEVERCLARVVRDGRVGVAAAVDRLSRSRPSPAAALVVTAALDEALPGAVRRARAAGMRVACVLCGPAAALDPDVRAAGARTAVAPTMDALGRALATGGRGARG